MSYEVVKGAYSVEYCDLVRTEVSLFAATLLENTYGFEEIGRFGTSLLGQVLQIYFSKNFIRTVEGSSRIFQHPAHTTFMECFPNLFGCLISVHDPGLGNELVLNIYPENAEMEPHIDLHEGPAIVSFLTLSGSREVMYTTSKNKSCFALLEPGDLSILTNPVDTAQRFVHEVVAGPTGSIAIGSVNRL